jgi:hypothetical protein
MLYPPPNSDDRHVGIIGDSTEKITATGKHLVHDVPSKFRENPSIYSQAIEQGNKDAKLYALARI